MGVGGVTPPPPLHHPSISSLIREYFFRRRRKCHSPTRWIFPSWTRQIRNPKLFFHSNYAECMKSTHIYFFKSILHLGMFSMYVFGMHGFKIFYGLQWFYTAKSVFSRLTPVCVSLIMAAFKKRRHFYFHISKACRGFSYKINRIIESIGVILALTGKKMFYVNQKSEVCASEKYKNQPRPLLRPRSVNFCKIFWKSIS